MLRADQRIESNESVVSAGIIATIGALQSNLAEKLRYWASSLIKNQEVMGHWSVNVDQVRFCLATEQLALDVDFFPPQVNCAIEMAAKMSTVYSFYLTSGNIPKHPEKFRADRTLRLEEFPTALMESLARLNA